MGHRQHGMVHGPLFPAGGGGCPLPRAPAQAPQGHIKWKEGRGRVGQSSSARAFLEAEGTLAAGCALSHECCWLRVGAASSAPALPPCSPLRGARLCPAGCLCALLLRKVCTPPLYRARVSGGPRPRKLVVWPQNPLSAAMPARQQAAAAPLTRPLLRSWWCSAGS